MLQALGSVRIMRYKFNIKFYPKNIYESRVVRVEINMDRKRSLAKQWIVDEQAPLKGWDFSYLLGRYEEG